MSYYYYTIVVFNQEFFVGEGPVCFFEMVELADGYISMISTVVQKEERKGTLSCRYKSSVIDVVFCDFEGRQTFWLSFFSYLVRLRRVIALKLGAFTIRSLVLPPLQ